ncbi:ABC transporter permease [Brevibacillus sp. HB1.1]|uniref:ABC transporter permease n=1 Tax=Brevibacillus sp. HB1.1 TaxID=2738808 RepID=UPI0015755C10|nr:ABC-2 family transporter protein [Brevibacillus sp. HB1.1]NTU29070.1 ABC transporter permease [Brevibacillus sp. HB1.1]
MVYWRIIRKSYRRNLQYRLSHVINNVASSIFGLVFIAIWTGVFSGKQVYGPYDVKTMGYYIAICQSVLWMTTFMSPGLNVQIAVRSGAVSLDMIKPVHYLWYMLSQEFGRLLYNACYRSVPIGLLLGLAVGFFFPSDPFTYFWFILSLLLGTYVGMLLFYLAGISSFWTTEIRWVHLILLSLIFGLGGQMIPIDLMPGMIGEVAPYLPFSAMIYYPVMTLLELAPPYGMLVQAGWALVLTAVALLVTNMARRKLEIQGG